MKHTITIFTALVAILGCIDTDDTFRDGDRFTFLDGSLDLIGVGTEPPEGNQVCCENGGCSPAVSGACPQGGVLHSCSDEETCNEDGSACWYECAPAQPPMSNDAGTTILSDPAADPMGEECGSGACCELLGPATAVMVCVNGTQETCDNTWLSCDAGMCFPSESPCFTGASTFSESCCSRG